MKNNQDNLFPVNVDGRSASQNADVPVAFVLPPPYQRHPTRAKDPYLPFSMSAYPAVLDAWSNINGELNNAGAMLSSHDEENYAISVGYARVNSSIVDWILVFAQSHSEVVSPIHNLRDTILASIFGVVAAIFVISL
jgi:hypothetical protein